MLSTFTPGSCGPTGRNLPIFASAYISGQVTTGRSSAAPAGVRRSRHRRDELETSAARAPPAREHRPRSG